jgi:hypothetical protein
VKAARQRPINETEAINIKRQMDYERADSIEAAERQAKGEKVTVSEVATSHEAERRAKRAEERPAVERQVGKAAKRKATMTGAPSYLDAPSLIPGGEWEWLSKVIPVLLKFAQDDTSAKMLTITAGPKLNRVQVREIGRWFEIVILTEHGEKLLEFVALLATERQHCHKVIPRFLVCRERIADC